MKTRILKSQLAVVMALLFPCMPAPLLAAPSAEIVNQVYNLSEDELFEVIIMRVKKDGVDATLDLADLLTTEAALKKETLDTIIKRYKERLVIFEDTILEPLRLKIEQIAHYNPYSPFLVLYEKTYDFAKNNAHNNLVKMLALLESHKKDENYKKASIFIAKLNTFSASLQKMQKDFEDKLDEIYKLAQKIPASITKKLNKDQIISSVKTRLDAIQARVTGPKFYTLLSNLLKRS